ncbi:flagellar motor switch protein FliN [Clostridium sp. MD294]|uniref:flagellar motor switch protein FliN n=1 Tax=Clostridium sp. MD294 TaxID=97138 RepID=UPI00138EE0F4|nr:flagellar motor switch protein FliN [Clostridium sp. MD294]NDO46401.1 flagellar motor switch protein FliN [Clostridium sp. MD294]
MSSNRFSPLEIDAIGEILNISLGASATAVSTMLSKRVDITTPRVQVLTAEEFKFTNLEPAIGVQITYVAGLEGTNVMLLKRKDVKSIVEILMMTEIPDEEFELNELNLSAICEVMNMMMGASATALSEFLGEVVDISTPEAFSIEDIQGFKDDCFGGEQEKVVISFDLKIEDYVESEFMNMMPVKLAKKLVSAFGVPMDEMGNETEPEPEPTPAATTESSGGNMSQEEIEKLLGNTASEPEPTPAASTSSSGGNMSQEEIEKLLGNTASEPEPTPAASTSSSGGNMSQEEIEKLLGSATSEPTPQPAPVPQPQPIPQPQPMPQMMQPQMQAAAPDMMQQMMGGTQQPQMPQQSMEPKVINVQPLPVDNLKATKENMGEEQKENLNMILGVPLEVSVEIGRTKKLVKEILELSQGSLVVLDKLAGDQVDLYVNGQCIAKGDVVVVNDNFGIRITEIIKKQDLIKGFGK